MKVLITSKQNIIKLSLNGYYSDKALECLNAIFYSDPIEVGCYTNLDELITEYENNNPHIKNWAHYLTFLE